MKKIKGLKKPKASQKPKRTPKLKRIFGNILLYVLTISGIVGGIASMFFWLAGQGLPQPNQEPRGIIEIWHIENFEGGISSRASFLTKAGNTVSKRYSEVFFAIKTIDAVQLEMQLNEGKKPDIISFSYGVGNQLLGVLLPQQNTFDIREDFLAAGRLEEKTYALPYMTGGYGLFALEEGLKKAGLPTDTTLSQAMLGAGYTKTTAGKQRIVYSLAAGSAAYNNPYALIDGQAKQYSINAQPLTQFDAYDNWMSRGNAVVLLGTQRDWARIENRISQNNMPPFRYEFLSQTDLVQFVGVCTSDDTRSAIVQLFLEELYSDQNQAHLKSIGMLSVKNNAAIYSEGEPLSQLQAALSAQQKLNSVFCSTKTLLEYKNSDMARLGLKE